MTKIHYFHYFEIIHTYIEIHYFIQVPIYVFDI